MHRRLCLTTVLVCGFLSAQPVLRLKSGRTPAPLGSQENEPKRFSPRHADAGSAARVHLLVQFTNEPDEQTVKALEDRGARVLAVVPDRAFLVSTQGEIDLEGLDVYWVGRLEPEDKLSALLGDSEAPVAAVVDLHNDEETPLGRRFALEAGLELLEHPDLARNQILVRGRKELLAAFARRDEVAYIFPASDELLTGAPVQACAGPLWAAGALGSAANLASTFGDGWDGVGLGTASLTYWLGTLAPGFPRDAVQVEIERALAAWSAAVQVDFTLTTTQNRTRSIDMFFAAGSHGDPYAFDGRGKILAHGFFPPPNAETIAGDLHFDADEMWRLGADVDVFSVALHELGHSLGLGHSDNTTAVMYPYYRKASALDPSDIESIRQLYAARTSTTTTPPTTPPPPPPTTPPPPPPPSGPDTVAPVLTVTTPSSTYYRTTASSIVVKGTAQDNVALREVTWKRGTAFGTCTGTTSWTSPSVTLPMGTSTFIIRAYDTSGNSTYRTITVVRQ